MWKISLFRFCLFYLTVLSFFVVVVVGQRNGGGDYHHKNRQALGYTIENVLKVRCYQCNQPFDCMTGSCYGDVCVKSQVNGGYVSKGCENYTGTIGIYDPHMKMRHYCKEEEVLGVDTINCYCRNEDYCNSTPSTFSILFLPLLLLIQIRL